MKQHSLALVEVPIGQFVLDDRNAKQHTEVQIEQMMRSIRDLGFNDPIGITGQFKVIEGHGRIEAARRLGMTVLPAIRLDHLSEEERVAYAVAHNQTQLNTGMDMNAVHSEFQRMGVKEADFMTLGFTADDVMFMDTGSRQNTGNSMGADHDSWKQHIPPVLRSRLEFDDETQQLTWYQLLEALRARFPECQTHAERLMRFIDVYYDER